MKMEVVNWFKENYKGIQIKKYILKYIPKGLGQEDVHYKNYKKLDEEIQRRKRWAKRVVQGLTHEVIHYKIYKKFDKEMELSFELNLFKDRYRFFCHCIYPSVYDLPIYYPIYIFIEFVHMIFDIIAGITRFGFCNIIYSLKDFIGTLFELKFKK